MEPDGRREEVTRAQVSDTSRMIEELSIASGRSGGLLLELMERYQITGLMQATHAQVKAFYDEWRNGHGGTEGVQL